MQFSPDINHLTMERLQALRKRPVRRSGKSAASSSSSQEALPLPLYLALHVTFSGFLLFSFLFLPRSSNYFGGDVNDQRISADRPEHPFLTPLTSSPISTMLWLDLGIWISVAWWAGHLRAWWDKEKKQGKSALEEVQARNGRSMEMLKVSQCLTSYKFDADTRVQAFGTATASTLGVSLLIHAVIVLCGAPLVE